LSTPNLYSISTCATDSLGPATLAESISQQLWHRQAVRLGVAGGEDTTVSVCTKLNTPFMSP